MPSHPQLEPLPHVSTRDKNNRPADNFNLDKKKRPCILLRLTPLQRKTLFPFFELIRKSNGEAALLAQVLPSGMVVKFIKPDEAERIATATSAPDGYVTYPEQQL